MATAQFSVQDVAAFKKQVFSWAVQFPISTYLDSNDYQLDKYHKYDLLVAVGTHTLFEPREGEDTFAGLQEFVDAGKEWVFGYLTYDLKNEIESLQSNNTDGIGFPKAGFYKPEIVISLTGEAVLVSSAVKDPVEVWGDIQAVSPFNPEDSPWLSLQPRMEKQDYLEAINQIREHIAAGDIYELNFCQEWYAESVTLSPPSLFRQLNELAQTPFAALLRWNDNYILCASPERFLAKRGDTLIAQPIKGTAPRGKSESEDEKSKEKLRNDPKERAENVMIVDLMRNDLAKSSVMGGVEVPELFGIYSFPSVHQMISTVTAHLRPDVHPVDAIKHAFPMGSMTGAPKIMAMKLIEQYEQSKRGLYSGAVGYFDPYGDFDFNVVIRSVLYNSANQFLSFQTGGAITWQSNPEKEYEESVLKGKLIRSILGER